MVWLRPRRALSVLHCCTSSVHGSPAHSILHAAAHDGEWPPCARMGMPLLACAGAYSSLCVQGNAFMLDIRVPPRASVTGPLDLHPRKVNSVSFRGTSHTFATSSTDASVCIWDLRSLGAVGRSDKAKACKPVATLSHSKACHGAPLLPPDLLARNRHGTAAQHRRPAHSSGMTFRCALSDNRGGGVRPRLCGKAPIERMSVQERSSTHMEMLRW